MNRGQIKQAIKDEMQLDPGLISEAERDRYLDAWLDDIASMGVLEKKAVIPVVAGQATYALPDTLLSLSEVSVGKFKLKLTEERDIGTGTPVYYSTVGKNITIMPTPEVNDNMTILFTYRPDYMTNDADSPDIPVEWHYLGVLYGVYRCHKKNGNIAVAKEYLSEYEAKKSERLREAVARLNTRITTLGDHEELPAPIFG